MLLLPLLYCPEVRRIFVVPLFFNYWLRFLDVITKRFPSIHLAIINSPALTLFIRIRSIVSVATRAISSSNPMTVALAALNHHRKRSKGWVLLLSNVVPCFWFWLLLWLFQEQLTAAYICLHPFTFIYDSLSSIVCHDAELKAFFTSSYTTAHIRRYCAANALASLTIRIIRTAFSVWHSNLNTNCLSESPPMRWSSDLSLLFRTSRSTYTILCDPLACLLFRQ